MIRFASLGSGSRGNATLVETRETRVLVDCGFGVREAIGRMKQLGVEPQALDALLVTHEHRDHLTGVAALARRYRLPVHLTVGTWLKAKLAPSIETVLITPEQRFELRDLAVDPVTVPHDAREPVQFLFECGGRRLGLLTDLGWATEHVRRRYRHCDALVLESNHDPRMLAEGPYPPSLKRRVGGQRGHLSNAQAGELLQQLGTDRLQWLVASHLSEKNNRPELAYEAISPLLDGDCSRLVIAAQNETTSWQQIA
ncbi:MBL fold metallo-hydrolase [Kushneria phosphatilytica]|uniref:MBL fold metallo-hydrolase n=1 Tax=Kushneria phosphatilytica TaxID=657387 RepID=A0A1S1NUA9_9GAMM|nr:MBL fold metallo-hydrolase [Kushneria phosphatilytica]OHV13443.1 MBL fold metallo-hydrolase [Kushneria phosphatilytica]QEL10526.1 MBL fold metallo-hydrolase [Kushneria phosphatilytica]